MIRLTAAACLAALWLSAARGYAGPTAEDRERAAALFREGRASMGAGRLEEACPRLAESQRLDPSGGTLLNLALCDERAGRLAHALDEFNEAAVIAQREGRTDREREATTRAGAIATRLPDAAAAAITAPPVTPPSRWWLSLAIGGAGVVGVALLLALRARLDDRRR